MLFSSHHAFTGSQTINEHSTIGILSALLLTIQFSFLYALPGIWSSITQTSYLGPLMSADQLTVLHEAMPFEEFVSFSLVFVKSLCMFVQVLVVASLISLYVNAFCMLYCALVMLVLGEISGKHEAHLDMQHFMTL